jgi:methylglutaconyl-CoA hydratase
MEYVLYETDNRVGYITLNRPAKRNALNEEVVGQLQQAFEMAENDEACKVIVLRGQGEVFCAGADLQYLQSLNGNTFGEHYHDSTHLMRLFQQIYTGKKVVIGQVHGHAIAGGCGLAAICDITFTVPEARFGYTEVKVGFVPAIVSVFLLRKIGESATKRLLLTGDLISAAAALDLGLVHYVVPAGELAAAVQDFAQHLCRENSAQSMELTKEILYRVQEMPLQEGLRYAAEMNAHARGTSDYRRGISAFLNKEKINW